MKAEVIEVFVDKDNALKQYNVGEVIDFPDVDRVKNLAARGLVRVIEEATGEKPKKASTRTKKS